MYYNFVYESFNIFKKKICINYNFPKKILLKFSRNIIFFIRYLLKILVKNFKFPERIYYDRPSDWLELTINFEVT